MVRIDYFLSGYRKITIKEAEIDSMINLFLKLNLPMKLKENTFLIKSKDYNKHKTILESIEGITISEEKGIKAFIKTANSSKGTLFAVIISLAIMLYFTSTVFDIRISGNENISDCEIEEALKNSDFKTGTPWRKFDKQKVQTDFLKNLPNISWITINRRGNVAYIEVIENDRVPIKPETTEKVTNIISDRDCVIEEINVKSGVATVKPGDIVKRGDILISGIIKTEKGDIFTRAEGEVYGMTLKNITAEAERTEEVAFTESEKLKAIYIKIFGFSLNILKIYGNSPAECVIIEDVEKCVLFDRYRLPFEIKTVKVRKTQKRQVERSDAELVEIAKERLDSAVISHLTSSNILKLRTKGGFTDKGYKMTSEIVYSTNIGIEKAIVTEGEGIS